MSGHSAPWPVWAGSVLTPGVTEIACPLPWYFLVPVLPHSQLLVLEERGLFEHTLSPS